MGRLFAEKTQEATPYRRQQARREGHVARSADLAAALVIAGFIAGAPLFVVPVLQAADYALRLSLSSVSWQPVDCDDCQSLVGHVVAILGPLSLGLAASVLTLAILANFVQGNVRWQPRQILPDWNRLRPGQRLASCFALHRWLRGALALAKVVSTLGVVATWLWRQREEIASLNGLAVNELAERMPQLGIEATAVAASCVVFFGLLDYGLERWQLQRSLRMTPEEIREEIRMRQGDPQIRMQRRTRHVHLVTKR